MFGVNPWKLMTWMGHERIDETMLSVDFAGNHDLATTMRFVVDAAKLSSHSHRRDNWAAPAVARAEAMPAHRDW